MNRNQLIGYVRSIAFEQEVLTANLIIKLEKFDLKTIKKILETHINNLKAPPSEGTFFSENFRKTQVASIEEILNNLTNIFKDT